MNFIQQKLTEDVLKKGVAIALLIGLIVLLMPFKNLLLFTFIFTFLFSKAQNFIHKALSKRFNIDKKIIAVTIFVITIGLVAFSLYIYIPKLTSELIDVKNDIVQFVTKNENPTINKYIEQIKNLDYANYISSYKDTALKMVGTVEKLVVAITMALILSLFVLLEEKGLKDFGNKLSRSKLKFFYEFYKNLGSKFLNSFGLIIELQFASSFVNGILAIIGLFFLGFPHVIGLGFVIFIASLIPVVGTVVAMIPICIIGFQIGGIGKVIAVIILVAVINLIEGYITKPLLMSGSVNLPVFLIFLALIFGEHFMGTWGLLLGLPLLMFLIEVFEVK